MMLPQQNGAPPQACADGQPTSNDHIIQRAHGWNATRKEVIGAPAGEKTRAKSKHRAAEQKLAEACDMAIRSKAGQP